MAKKNYELKDNAAVSVVRGTRIDITKIGVTRLVTLPTWKWADGETKYFRCESEIREGRSIDSKTLRDSGEVIKPSKKDEPKMAPARIMQVTDLQSGTRCEMVVGAVLESNLIETYEKGTYVGKCFQVTRSKVEGKRYKNYSLIEIDISSAELD